MTAGFLDEVQKAKIKIYGTNQTEWLPVLLTIMDGEQIPVQYGGRMPDLPPDLALSSMDPPQDTSPPTPAAALPPPPPLAAAATTATTAKTTTTTTPTAKTTRTSTSTSSAFVFSDVYESSGHVNPTNQQRTPTWSVGTWSHFYFPRVPFPLIEPAQHPHCSTDAGTQTDPYLPSRSFGRGGCCVLT